MINRRDFIKSAGIFTAGCMMDKQLLLPGKKQKAGLQMYTLRKVTGPKNIAAVIARIAAIGYKELEIFGYSGRDKFWGMEPKAFKALLKEHKLAATSAHISFEHFLTGKDENELRMICEAASIAGNKFIVAGWLPEQYRNTKDDYKRIAAKLNKAAAIAGQYNLRMSYHNHDFEFALLDDTTTGYDIILQEADAKLVPLELDIYWAIKAGVDPVKLFEQYPGRFPLWHVKDMDAVTGSFTEVGAGSIDFKRIFEQAATAGLEHFFIEQDETTKDVFESIKQSFDHVNEKLLVK